MVSCKFSLKPIHDISTINHTSRPRFGVATVSARAQIGSLHCEEVCNGRNVAVGVLTSTLWLFNIAMENGPFIDGLPIINGDFPWLC